MCVVVVVLLLVGCGVVRRRPARAPGHPRLCIPISRSKILVQTCFHFNKFAKNAAAIFFRQSRKVFEKGNVEPQIHFFRKGIVGQVWRKKISVVVCMTPSLAEK